MNAIREWDDTLKASWGSVGCDACKIVTGVARTVLNNALTRSSLWLLGNTVCYLGIEFVTPYRRVNCPGLV